MAESLQRAMIVAESLPMCQLNYEFHPVPFWHYGWCIMNSIHGIFGIMDGVLWISSMAIFCHYGWCIMSSIHGIFGIMDGVLWIASVAILSLWVVYHEFHPSPFWHYGWCVMNSIRDRFGIMGGVLYYEFHPGPFWHYGWCIMNSIHGHFVIMGGVLYYEFHPWPFWQYGCIMDSIHLWPCGGSFSFLFFSFLKEITLNPR